MESQPQNPEFRINPKIFTHASIYNFQTFTLIVVFFGFDISL